ncbi:helix-turn-helix domain-containing protein [Streptomyces sp. NPDC001787]|uniref:helix-turn-helix domain-containing protein n=1 Tax=Streptomyces sp. NPDC001787 TaxID=3154523 RepID=UPI003319D4B1
MPNLADLLAAPGLESVRPLAGPLDAVAVTGVRLVPARDRIVEVPPGTVAILLAPVPGLLLDVAVRDAAAAGAAALVLTGPDEAPLSTTVRVLAERGRVAVLHAEGDLAALVIAVHRAAAGDPSDALARIEAAARRLPPMAGDPDRVTATAGRVLGRPVERRAPGPDEEGAAAAGADGEVRLASAARPGHAGTAVRAVLALAALAATGGATGDVPVRSRGQLLAELLTAPRDRAVPLAARGRALGLPVDSWHIALRLVPVALDGTERYRVLENVAPEALNLLRTVLPYAAPPAAPAHASTPPTASATAPAHTSTPAHASMPPPVSAATPVSGPSPGVQWNATVVDDALTLLCTLPADPGPDGHRQVLGATRRAVERLRRLHPDADLRCGVGVPHRGPLGIRSSAREARAALPRAGGEPVAAHDAAGVDRMLLEWYASEAAREAVGELLAPVMALGPERAEPLLRTLQTYLDHNNSPARAAEVLHLHRNAVGARIRRFTELTGADLNDPEQRIALQLACRAGLAPPPP